MLAREWKACSRKKPIAIASAFAVSWSPNTVRFSEALQVVDLVDCFAVLYASNESAKVAMHKYFSVDWANTLSIVGVSKEELFYTVKWHNARQGRTCIKANAATKFFGEAIPHVPNSKNLADILNKDTITSENTNEHFNSAVICIAQEKAASALETCSTVITREDALAQVSGHIVQGAYQCKVMAEREEDKLRISRAQHECSVAEAKKESELHAIFEDRKMADIKRQRDADQSYYEDAGRMMQQKIKMAEAAGFDDIAELFKKKYREALMGSIVTQ
jgi:hypothetical protein